MSKVTAFYIVINIVLNVVGALIFWRGGADPGMRWAWFIGGNVFGIAATWFSMKIYTQMNVNLANVICACGSSLLLQFVLWGLFSSPVSPMQWLGIMAVAAGMALTLIGPKCNKAGAREVQDAECREGELT